MEMLPKKLLVSRTSTTYQVNKGREADRQSVRRYENLLATAGKRNMRWRGHMTRSDNFY